MQTKSMQRPVFRFGRFTLDTGAGLLRSGAEEVVLRNKSLELLTHLVRNAGRVVLKDELLTAVWNGLNVTEDSLTQCIHDIRRALDDRERALIRTVPRRGYLFPADILETIPLPPDPAQPEFSVAKVRDRPPLAVLPFVNIGGELENEFFAAGMSEDITTALSRIGELFIIAPHADYAGRGNSATLKEVAEELGARYVLKGSVRVKSDKLRVTVQLGDAAGHNIWAERFDAGTADIFSVQDEITRSVSLAIQVKLTFGDFARLWEGQTKSLSAWEKMVQARNLFLLFTPGPNREAQRLLEEALKIDPNYTGAMIQLGLCHWWKARYVLTEDKEVCLQLAEQQSDNALRIDPAMGSAYMLKGGVAFLRDRHQEAIDYCETAVALAPSDSWAMAYLGLVCSYSGKCDRAVDVLKTAIRLSPQPLAWYYESLATACMWTGDLVEAAAAAEKNFIMEPEEPLAYVVLATVFGFQGRYPEAERAVSELRRHFPGYCLKDVLISERYANPADLQKVIDILRRAGMPH